MLRALIKPVASLLLVAGSCLAESAPVRPECNKNMAGKLWPPTAPKDKEAFRQLSRSGELQVCARTTWHYRWQGLTVNARDLQHKSETPKQVSQTRETSTP